MNLLDGILAEALDDRTMFIIAGLALTLLLVRQPRIAALHAVDSRKGRRQRFYSLIVLTTLHAALVPVAGILRVLKSEEYLVVRMPCLIFAAIAAVGMGGFLLFSALLPRLHIRPPLILQDIMVAGASIVAVFVVASRNGFNLSGLIATSAVITGVVGFSLQDTLGNIAGGLALQLDNSIEVGDWIKFGDLSGRISEIRWRYTAVETRNWETMLIPNSMLMKGQLLVLGRRSGQAVQWRRWVYFNVDFRYQPSDVIAVVQESVCQATIDRVAKDPPPNCILLDFTESYCRYAVRYWLLDLAADDPTDSVVRSRIYYALQRASIPLSIPAHALFVTEDNGQRREEKTHKDFERRKRLLKTVELFDLLTESDLSSLAEALRYAPFTRDETLTREGADAHWLYISIEGEVSVRVSEEGGLEKEVARLHSGQFFGEMGLMTGAKRAATVVALSKDVECYRLDKAAFEAVIQQRPKMAEHVADILAKRRVELQAARENLDSEARARRLSETKTDLLQKIQSFFGIDERKAS